MKNKSIKKYAVFAIASLFIVVAFAPAINSSFVKIVKYEKYDDVSVTFDSIALFDDEVTYDVYFGTTNPPPKVVSNQSETSYDPGTLEYNTTYYWQIIAWNEQGESAEGPIWHFTTELGSPSVETLDADPVGKTNATLNGKILEDGGDSCEIRFRYREDGETEWIYPSDWYGSYVTDETFSEEISGLNQTTTYEFQAGAKNSVGEDWGDLKNFTTSANQPPVAVISAPSTADKKTSITFDGSGSYDPDGYITEYLWDFGDGDVVSGMIVNHSYENSGTYIVTLKVTDDDGAFNVANHQITIINHAPVASFVADQYYIEPGQTVTFDGTGSFDPDGDSLIYEWYLDGQLIGNEAVITHTFTDPGSYTVTLTVTDDDPVNPLSDSVSAVIVVNSPPIADFTYFPEDPWVMEVIEFDATISYDLDGTIVNYSWDFGNGDTGYGMIIYYTYVSGGWYTVTLTVTDDLGATGYHVENIFVDQWYDSTGDGHNSDMFVGSSVVKDILVMETSTEGYPPSTPSDPYPDDGATNVPIDVVLSWTGGQNHPPNPPTIKGPTSGKAGEPHEYTFNATDPDGDQIYYYVDWGDTSVQDWFGPFDSGEEATASHTWSEGTFTIRAKAKDVYDAEGDWGTLEVTMPVNQQSGNSQLLLPQVLRFFERSTFSIFRNLLGL